MREEELRSQHQASLLKLREKALKEKTKAELAWLKQQRQRLRDKGADDVYPQLDHKEKTLLKHLQKQQVSLWNSLRWCMFWVNCAQLKWLCAITTEQCSFRYEMNGRKIIFQSPFFKDLLVFLFFTATTVLEHYLWYVWVCAHACVYVCGELYVLLWFCDLWTQAEIRHLREANRLASKERQSLLKQHEEIARMQQEVCDKHHVTLW